MISQIPLFIHIKKKDYVIQARDQIQCRNCKKTQTTVVTVRVAWARKKSLSKSVTEIYCFKCTRELKETNKWSVHPFQELIMASVIFSRPNAKEWEPVFFSKPSLVVGLSGSNVTEALSDLVEGEVVDRTRWAGRDGGLLSSEDPPLIGPSQSQFLEIERKDESITPELFYEIAGAEVMLPEAPKKPLISEKLKMVLCNFCGVEIPLGLGRICPTCDSSSYLEKPILIEDKTQVKHLLEVTK